MNYEMWSIIGPIAVAAAVIMVLAYWACRAIGYWYNCKESKWDYQHDREMRAMDSADEDYRQIAYQHRKFEYDKRLIQSATDRVRMLSMDVVKQINDNRLSQAKTMMDDSANFMKRMCELEKELDE